MRSIFAKILLWSLGTLAVSLVAFVGMSRLLSERAFRQGAPPGNPLAMQAEDAREAFETGGKEGLTRYLQNLYRFFPDEHYLTDGSGRDLLTGESRSNLLAKAKPGPGMPGLARGPIVMAAATGDQRYFFIAVADRPAIDPWSFIPYYALVLAAVALLCYLLAVNLATPLRVLAGAFEGFGKGDLSVRVNSHRRDEIGDLGRAFDQMAGRIETLVTAERRLLQDISHELRSPLARLSFAVELVRTAKDPEAAVARLKKEVDRLTHLVGSLLEVTRGEAEPSSLRLEEISLDELLKELARECLIEAEARGCRVVLDDEQSVSVHGERELLRRAMENIVRNAIRHAPAGTPVEIRFERQPEFVSVFVRDYGPGVPEALLSDIFKPFFRVDSERDRSSGGVGLGLAIAQRAVTLHNGKLSATNMNPGLQLRVDLPCEPQPVAAGQAV